MKRGLLLIMAGFMSLLLAQEYPEIKHGGKYFFYPRYQMDRWEDSDTGDRAYINDLKFIYSLSYDMNVRFTKNLELRGRISADFTSNADLLGLEKHHLIVERMFITYGSERLGFGFGRDIYRSTAALNLERNPVKPVGEMPYSLNERYIMDMILFRTHPFSFLVTDFILNYETENRGNINLDLGDTTVTVRNSDVFALMLHPSFNFKIFEFSPHIIYTFNYFTEAIKSHGVLTVGPEVTFKLLGSFLNIGYAMQSFEGDTSLFLMSGKKYDASLLKVRFLSPRIGPGNLIVWFDMGRYVYYTYDPYTGFSDSGTDFNTMFLLFAYNFKVADGVFLMPRVRFFENHYGDTTAGGFIQSPYPDLLPSQSIDRWSELRIEFRVYGFF